MQNEKNSVNKTVKLREKEIVRLQSKTENLEDNVKNKKAENKLLKEEKSKLLKEKILSDSNQKKIPSALISIATNTAPVSNIEAYTQTETKEDPMLHSIPTVKPVQALSTMSSPIVVNEELFEYSKNKCGSLCQHRPQCIIREPF